MLCELWLSVGPVLGELGGGEAAVSTMGSVGVVVNSPVLGEHLGLEQGIELPAVEVFVVEPAVE